MRPELGLIYLAVLADAMSRHNALSPATDDPRVHRAPGSLNELATLLLGTADGSQPWPTHSTPISMSRYKR